MNIKPLNSVRLQSNVIQLSADEKLLSVNYNDGITIAQMTLDSDILNINIPLSVVNYSSFDPSAAKDNMIYFVVE